MSPKVRKKIPSKKGKPSLGPSDLISASYCVLCQDAINGKDESISLLRLIDDIRTPELPVLLNKMVIVFEFMRNTAHSREDFENSGLLLLLQLVNPSGKIFPLGEYAPAPVAPKNGWSTHRVIMEVPAGSLKLENQGNYLFRAMGKTTTHPEEEELIARRLRVQILER